MVRRCESGTVNKQLSSKSVTSSLVSKDPQSCPSMINFPDKYCENSRSPVDSSSNWYKHSPYTGHTLLVSAGQLLTSPGSRIAGARC